MKPQWKIERPATVAAPLLTAGVATLFRIDDLESLVRPLFWPLLFASFVAAGLPSDQNASSTAMR